MKNATQLLGHSMRKSITETDAAAPVNNNPFRRTDDGDDINDNVFAETVIVNNGDARRSETSPLRAAGKCWPEDSKQLELTVKCLESSLYATEDQVVVGAEDEEDEEEEGEGSRERRRIVSKIVTLLCLAGLVQIRNYLLYTL